MKVFDAETAPALARWPGLGRALLLVGVLVLLLAAGCGSSREALRGAEYKALPPPSADPAYTVFLIGDAGAARLDPMEPVLQLLNRKLRAADSNAAVLFLGDNAYPHGLPPADASTRAREEQRLDAQLRAVEGFGGRVVFLPGNHDWRNDHSGGWDAIRREEAYVEARLGTDDAFLPGGGCPGPAVVDLREDLRLLVLDTEWWIYPHEKPTLQNSDCPFAEKERFLAAVDSVADASGGRRLLVAAHHPIYSNGKHGGYFPLATRADSAGSDVEYLHLPFQWVGEVLPWMGLRQSLAGYGELREHLLEIFRRHDGLVYAAGHSQNLQYHPVDGQHYLVSGAGSKLSFAAGTGTAAFAYNHKGFLALSYYPNGAVRLTAWTPEGDGTHGRVVYAKLLQPAATDGAAVPSATAGLPAP